MSSLPKPGLTPAEYLALERASEGRHEYLDGEMYAMSGASADHVRIAGNTFASLHAQLRGKPCEPFATDPRVSTDPTRQYFYPDVVVACGDQRSTMTTRS